MSVATIMNNLYEAQQKYIIELSKAMSKKVEFDVVITNADRHTFGFGFGFANSKPVCTLNENNSITDHKFLPGFTANDRGTDFDEKKFVESFPRGWSMEQCVKVIKVFYTEIYEPQEHRLKHVFSDIVKSLEGIIAVNEYKSRQTMHIQGLGITLTRHTDDQVSFIRNGITVTFDHHNPDFPEIKIGDATFDDHAFVCGSYKDVSKAKEMIEKFNQFDLGSIKNVFDVLLSSNNKLKTAFNQTWSNLISLL